MEENTTYNENEFFSQMELYYDLIITRKKSKFIVMDYLTGYTNSYNKDKFIELLENKGLIVSINGNFLRNYKYTLEHIHPTNEGEGNTPSPPVTTPSEINYTPNMTEGFTVPDKFGFTVESSDNFTFDYSEYNPLNLDEESVIAREICIQSSKKGKENRIPSINIGDKSFRIMYEYSNDYITVYGCEGDDDGDKTKKNIYYLAFRGTKLSDIEDLKTDFDLLINGITRLPEEYNLPNKNAIPEEPLSVNGLSVDTIHYRIYEAIMITVKLILKVENCKIIFTGHSLGGIIAFILMKYSKGCEGTDKPWTTKIDGKEKSWIYIKQHKDKIYHIKEKIFEAARDFKCITFNTATPSTTNILYESVNCSENKHWWCSKTIHHVIIGDKIPENLYKVLDTITNNYIKLYITGSINNKLKRHKIKNFRCKFSDGSLSKPCMGLTADRKIIYDIKGKLKKKKKRIKKKRSINKKSKKSNKKENKRKKTNKRTRRIYK